MTAFLTPPSSSIRAAHRHQVLEAFDQVLNTKPRFAGLINVAIARVTDRLKDGYWNGYSLTPVKRKDRQPAVRHGNVPVIRQDAVEYVIVYALARTWPAAQFSVDARGLVFAGQLNGYHRKSGRFYVAGLSTILDEAAELLDLAKGGAGGRFYIRGTDVELADGRTLLGEIDVHEL